MNMSSRPSSPYKGMSVLEAFEKGFDPSGHASGQFEGPGGVTVGVGTLRVLREIYDAGDQGRILPTNDIGLASILASLRLVDFRGDVYLANTRVLKYFILGDFRPTDPAHYNE